jgi:cyanate permease
MSSTLTQFGVRLPLYQGTDANGVISAQDIATTAFLANVQTLTNFTQEQVFVNSAGTVTEYNQVVGYITAAQAPTALGYLSTLNAALSTPVFCVSNTVTSQP